MIQSWTFSGSEFVAGEKGRPHRLGQGTVAMARALDEIVRLDRRWFWAHPQRQHRCRWPETAELDLCDCDRGVRLVMAIRHLGRGCLVYQPLMFQGALPASEESTAALFTLAATSPEPIPVIAQMEVLAMNRSQHPSGRWCVAVPALVVFG
jgi:hypothetical protein